MDTKEICDKACEILRLTNDGDDLAGEHLSFIEAAINCGLNDRGETALIQLLEQCKSEEGYKRPWHLGVEFMTKDTDNYIYFKDIQVEHYTFRGDTVREKKALVELQARCLLLEKYNFEVNSSSTVWTWENYFYQMSEEDREQQNKLVENLGL